MVATGYCNNCDKQVLLSNDEVGNTKLEAIAVYYIPNGQQFEIHFFVCPHCLEIQTVQIDNSETKRMLMNSLEILKKSKKTKKDKRKQVLKLSFQSNEGKLNQERLSLSVWADGKTFKDHNGKDFIYKAPLARDTNND